MDNGVTTGVYQLSDGNNLDWSWTRQWRDWIKAYYRRIGRDPSKWRADVLELAHQRGWLNEEKPFGVFVYLFYKRLRMRDDVEKVGAANESDLYGPHPDHWTFEAFRTWKAKPLQANNLPKIVCSPFAKMSRARIWSHAELIGNINPAPRNIIY